ncbi:MAG: hypothetical protein IKA78_01910 [Oscillospiraceae bacterium]|nr:hypothetical protein [Oscillospiraceae bacterium]
MARKGGNSIRTKIYHKFRGVDFSTDPSLVDDSRSPWAPNIYADMGGMPCKRPGWMTVKRIGNEVDGVFRGEKINGLFRAKIAGAEHLLCHAGEKLYKWDETDAVPTELASGLSKERSTAVYLKEAVWIFAGNKLLVYDIREGEEAPSAKDAKEIATVPLVTIGSAPSGGGVVHQSVNLLTQKREADFCGDGQSTEYVLPEKDVKEIVSVFVNGIPLEKNKYNQYGELVAENWKLDSAAGKLNFANAPSRPTIAGEDNVKIVYTAGEDNSSKIANCRIAIAWGIGGTEDRIVASGNPEYPNQDWISQFGDGAYWPDLQYSVVGSKATAIVGYRRFGEQLAIFKEDNGQDSTVFLRSGNLGSSGEAIFTTKPCVSGEGAVSRFGFGNIGNEQLILTKRGVYALTNNILTAEKIMQNRSYRVDPKLIDEEKLSESVSCAFDGCYLVFVNGHVYGLDGRQQRSYPSRSDTEFLYECFYWENVPARCVLRVVEGDSETLFFGTDDGRICKFKTDDKTLRRYSDDGDPITAIWSTKQDDDGDPMILKTLLKKGNAVTIKPYDRSSAKILFRTDQDAVAWQAAEGTMDIFNWEDIDFARFTFNANDAAQEIPLNRKVKNYKRLQIVVKNETADEGFGVYAITKHFVSGNFAKK